MLYAIYVHSNEKEETEKKNTLYTEQKLPFINCFKLRFQLNFDGNSLRDV